MLLRIHGNMVGQTKRPSVVLVNRTNGSRAKDLSSPVQGLGLVKREVPRPQLSGISLNPSHLPLSIGLGIGGVAALVASDFLPSPFKTVSFVGGLGLLGWAVLNVLDITTAGPHFEEPFLPTQTKADLMYVTGHIISPAKGSTVDPLLGLKGWYYPIKFSVTNRGSKKLEVTPYVSIQEFQVLKPSAKSTSISTSKKITLEPGQTKQSEDVEAPITASDIVGIDAVAALMVDGSKEVPGGWQVDSTSFRIL